MVLIIPGSGPTDRDGNSPLGVVAAPYRLLAEGLAERGIGSVRIDKRGLFGSRGATPDANAVTIADYVHDTQAWIDAIHARTGVGRVWLLGHSEGGLIALAAAAAGKSRIAGLILVATAGRPLGELLKEQLRANPANGPLLASASRVIDALAAGQRVEAARLPPALAPLFNPALQGFLISAFALDPGVLARGTDRPILILQGGRDLQVSVLDAELLLRAVPHAMLIALPDTNHVLKQVNSDAQNINLATYADADLPLAPGVVESVASFVRSHQS